MDISSADGKIASRGGPVATAATAMCFIRGTILALALMIGTTGATGPALGAAFRGLGFLPGGEVNNSFTSHAYAISADGTTVVGDSNSTAGTQAFRWTAAGGMQPLGVLDDGIRIGTTAYGVNADGSVVVGATHTNPIPWRWTSSGSGGVMQALSGFTSGTAYGVSSDSSILTGTGNINGANVSFRWTPAAGAQPLPGGPDGTNFAARAIGGDGSVIGGVVSGNGSQRRPARWDASTGAVSPLTLPPNTGLPRTGAVSADSTTIVGTLRTLTHKEAFRWTADTGLQLLDVPESGLFANAYATSGDGSILVGDGFLGAIVYDDAHGPRTLKDALLQSDPSLNLAGWTLTVARGVSADGNTIVGIGTNPAGYPEAWIAQIPEPAAGSLMLAAPLLLPLKRRPRCDARAAAAS